MSCTKIIFVGMVTALTALLLTACGSSSTSAPQLSEQAAPTGTVTFAVQFPQAPLKKALMDDRTVEIQIAWNTYGSTNNSVTLTPDAGGVATTTVEVPVGQAEFTAWAYIPGTDPLGNPINQELEMVSTMGDIVAGANTVTITFLTGDWQLVDASDNPLPLTFTDSAGNPTTLAGFTLASEHLYAAQGATKAATIDYSKPSGWGSYGLQWYSQDAGGALASIGPAMEAEQESQFGAGNVNNSGFWSDWLNLTAPERSDSLTNFDIVPLTGDRLLFIFDYVGNEPGFSMTDAGGADMIPVFDALGDSMVADANHLSGHLVQLTFESSVATPLQQGVDCDLFWSQAAGPAAARSAALNETLAQAAAGLTKAAPGDLSVLTTGLLTVQYDECDTPPYSSDGDGDGDFMQDFLTLDINGNGLYDAADGDQFTDNDTDGTYDFVLYAPQVDGDGDGDFRYESLTFDANHNWRYDLGDTYSDDDGDGRWDYTFTAGDTFHFTEEYSNVLATEFRALGNQTGTVLIAGPPVP